MAQAASSTITAKDLYHIARRAGVRASQGHDGRFHVLRSHTLTHTRAWARAALLEHLGRDTLPKGLPDRLEPAVQAVQAARAVTGSATLHDRLLARLRGKVLREAGRRRLPTSLDLAKNGSAALQVRDAQRIAGRWVLLLIASGYADYSSRVGGYNRSLAILGGLDDNGLWAVRVPGTLESVFQGLEWLKPAEVRKAEEAGRTVLRQGDVWIVERKRGDAMSNSALPEGHVWDAQTRTIRHQDHAPVHVPFGAIAYRQSTLAGDGQGRRRGD